MALIDNLISYWKLDETSDGSGAVTRNDSHSTNHLTDNNTTASGTGKINAGVDFERTNSEYLSRADNASLSPTSDISFNFWVNFENAPGSKPRDVAVPAPAESVQKRSGGGFVSSSIRVDNLQNVAILEYRSETGEVVQQYPAQSQIDAFKRAAVLRNQEQSGVSSAGSLKI